MKKYSIIITMGYFLFLLIGCSDDFINDAAAPLSQYSPENAFATPEGLEAALIPARKLLRQGDFGYGFRIRSEYFWTDISYVSNQSPTAARDAPFALNPFSNAGQTTIFTYWSEAYRLFKDTNTVINRIDSPEYESDQQRNAILAEAFFHRAYWYYRLVHRFKDVPWTGQEITEPRVDFFSFSQEAILNKIKEDLEYAVQWLPENAQVGEVNRAAGNHLLTKVYLSVGQFEDAITAASRVIDGGRYALMTNRFGNGIFADNPSYDVLWDLHRKENIGALDNTEGILIAADAYNLPGNSNNNNLGSGTNRFWMPLWWFISGNEYQLNNGEDAMELALGRSVGWVRPNNHFNYVMKAEDSNDGRYSDTNWWGLEDYFYNKPGTSVVGQQIQITDVGIDSISRMFEFPYYKLHTTSDVPGTRNDGGFRNFYVFRLAETFLLRAEAYWWLNQMQNAADDLNEVRARAGAGLLTAADINIDTIMDERARELYSEEPRSTELARVSYIFASLNKAGYSLATISNNNYMYDKMNRTCPELFNEIEYQGEVYRFAPHNIYWPIPQNAIDANSQGVINQNEGYSGAENNIAAVTVITDKD